MFWQPALQGSSALLEAESRESSKMTTFKRKGKNILKFPLWL